MRNEERERAKVSERYMFIGQSLVDKRFKKDWKLTLDPPPFNPSLVN